MRRHGLRAIFYPIATTGLCLLLTLLVQLSKGILPLGVPAAAHAQGITPTPTASLPALAPIGIGGADFVVLIDQSASMWSSHNGSAPNDPNSVRIEAAKGLIDRLGYDVIFFDPQRINRLAVLSFAGQAVLPPDLDSTEIHPPDLDTWKNQRETLKGKINSHAEIDGTDFEDAFQLAYRAFSGPMATPPVGNPGPRQKAMFLITDGCPAAAKTVGGIPYVDPENWSDSPEKGQYADWQSYYRKWVQAYMDDLTTNFQREFGSDYYLFVAAVNNGNDDYWSLCGPYWEKIVKQIARPGSFVDSRVDITQVPDIMLKASTTVLPSKLQQPFVALPSNPQEMEGSIPPYLDKAVITILKARQESNVLLYRQLGDSSTLVRDKSEDPNTNVIDHVKDGPIERWTINRPVPGIWGIVKEGLSDVKIYTEQIPIRVQMQPLDPLPMGSTADITYTLQVAGPQGTPQPFTDDASYDPQYLATAQATIVAPDGTDLPTPRVDRVSAGVYVVRAVTLPQVGEYKITLVGTAKDPKPQNPPPDFKPTQQVFQDDQGRIEVYKVTPFEFAAEQPKPAQALPIHSGLLGLFAIQPVPIQVRITAPGQPFTVTEAIQGSLNDVFEARLVAPDGKNDSALLTYDAKQDRFIGALGSRMESEGTYTLTVSFKASSQYQYKPTVTVRQVNFARGDGLLEKPATWGGLGVVLLVGLAGLAGWWWWITSNPVVGELEFLSGAGKSLGNPISLARHRRRLKISAKELKRKNAALGLGEITARLAEREPDEPAAVVLSMKDSQGLTLLDEETLSDKSSTSLGPGLYVRYRS